MHRILSNHSPPCDLETGAQILLALLEIDSRSLPELVRAGFTLELTGRSIDHLLAQGHPIRFDGFQVKLAAREVLAAC